MQLQKLSILHYTKARDVWIVDCLLR